MFSKIISSPMVKVSARYGAIAGVLCIIFLVTFFYMGRSPFLINPYLDFRVPLFALLIFFSLKEVRDYYNGGILYMWQGMGTSMLFVAFAALIAALGIVIFGTIQPQFLADYVTEFTKQIRELPADRVEQIGKETLDRSLNALPKTTIGDLASLYVWQSFVMGFFISVIISVILRRQPKPQ
ncbi:MAG: DUF4199 domain-containing protein [Cyclobacteriaceae bacterium]|nr:DUF4199 domain-containing protein [Cyclobacteriaceae bacterium]